MASAELMALNHYEPFEATLDPVGVERPDLAAPFTLRKAPVFPKTWIAAVRVIIILTSVSTESVIF